MVKTSVCSETPITQKTIKLTSNINQFTHFCITRDTAKIYFQTECHNNHGIIVS